MQTYKYLFGPVPSRRLGISLGVDLVPFKTCTHNCVYCECGPTKKLTLRRKEYIDTGIILKELDNYLSSGPELDYITFSGGGEPTLNSGIGKVITFLKENYPDYGTALLTNGSLLYREDVIDDIRDCSLVIPSLDAVSEDIYKKINNPPEGYSAGRVVGGIKKLGVKTSAEIWVEIFIVPGLNDTISEVESVKKALSTIRVDKIQLNRLDRPAAAEGVKQAPLSSMKKVQQQLYPLESEIIGTYKTKKKNVKRAQAGSLEKKILSLVKRRPCTADDIAVSFGVGIRTVTRCLRKLENSDKIIKLKKERGEFYKSND